MLGSPCGRRAATVLTVALACVTLSACADASARTPSPTGLSVTAVTQRSVTVAWQATRPRRSHVYVLYLRGRRANSTRHHSATLRNLRCGRSYVVEVDARRRHQRRSRRASVSASTAACRTVDLSRRCSGQDCDKAFAGLRPGTQYFLPAGVWKFSRPISIPSNVTLTGDGPGIGIGTDLVYTGPPISGAIVTAGARGRDWVNGHIAGLEIETNQLHQLRLRGDTQFATRKIEQAGTGLKIINPTATSTVSNVNVWKFGSNSVLIDNRAVSPGAGLFQFSDFFVGSSPHPLEVRGSSARLLVRFGGIDLGPLSQLGMLFAGNRRGATAVVESVKIEGDYDVPGYVVSGSAPVVFVGSTRYLNQSLYVDNPMNSAPAFLGRNPSGAQTKALQCLACTALGEQTALAFPDLSLAIPTSKWGINLHHLTPGGARAVAQALATPETPLARPHDVINLARRCVAHNCDAALANLKFGGRYHLPAGVWEFSRPFTIPSTATLFGDGAQLAAQGGTVLRYVGSSVPGGAAVRFGVGHGDTSATRLFSLRIDTDGSFGAGFGVRARDATNASTIENLSIAGFPDGQLLLDATPAGAGSGPNFLRIARFSLKGGRHPLQVEGGRQTLLIEQGKIRVGAGSEEGLNLSGGEELAATRVVESVSVTGKHDVPGFRVRGPAVTAFIHSSRTAGGARLTSPGFLYTAIVPRPVTECLRCSVSGLKTAFWMPQLGTRVMARDGARFDSLNPNAALQTTRAPFNVDLPAAIGATVVGKTLTAANGAWTNSPTGYAYQWIRCKPAHVPSNPATRCAPIAEATRSTYHLTSADSDFYLRLSVVATNAFGARTATSLPVLVSG